MEAERPGVQKQIAAANRELEQAKERHEEIVWPLECKLERIAQAGRDASDVRRQLQDTCTKPDLLDAMADVKSERDALTKRCHELDLECRELKRRGQSDLEESGHARSEADAVALRNRGQNWMARAKQYEPELTTLAKKLAKLE